MLYQIVLSITLLILAFTTLPKLDADADGPTARQQTIEPGTPAPPLWLEQDQPKAIDIRAIDPSLNEIARWLSENFELPYANEAPHVERVPVRAALSAALQGAAAAAVTSDRRRAFDPSARVSARARRRVRRFIADDLSAASDGPAPRPPNNP